MDLINAIKENDFINFTKLIKNGSDINSVDEDGISALMHSIINNSYVIINVLLTRGANVNYLDRNNRSALMYASKKGNLKFVQILIIRGANINNKDVDGNTALTLAKEIRNQRIIDELIANGATETGELSIEEQKQKIIIETNNAITTDTSVVSDILLTDKGCDVIESGCEAYTIPIQQYIDENPENSVVIKIIDSSTNSRHFLFTKDNLIQVLKDSIVYPCLKANNTPGIESNVITDLPLYNIGKILGVRVLVKKGILDQYLENLGNLYIVLNKKIYSYVSVASHDIIYNQSSYVGALHCNNGSEPENLFNIKKVNFVGGYYNKYKKYNIKLVKLKN